MRFKRSFFIYTGGQHENKAIFQVNIKEPFLSVPKTIHHCSKVIADLKTTRAIRTYKMVRLCTMGHGICVIWGGRGTRRYACNCLIFFCHLIIRHSQWYLFIFGLLLVTFKYDIVPFSKPDCLLVLNYF